jgi:hypothetical protein
VGPAEVETATAASDPFVQLTATAYDAMGMQIPRVEFTWSSSDEGIATVDTLYLPGMVSAVGPGCCEITAEAGDIGPAQGTGVVGTAEVVVLPMILNNNFFDGTYDWTYETCDNAPGTYVAQALVDPLVGWCLEIIRTGSLDYWDCIRLSQEQAPLIELGAFCEFYLEADVNVMNGTMEPGGASGLDYPATIGLSFLDDGGAPAAWLHGFHHQPSASWPGLWDQVPPGAWYHWCSPNLAPINHDGSPNSLVGSDGVAFTPAQLTWVVVGGSGWDFHARITNLCFRGRPQPIGPLP